MCGSEGWPDGRDGVEEVFCFSAPVRERVSTASAASGAASAASECCECCERAQRGRESESVFGCQWGRCARARAGIRPGELLGEIPELAVMCQNARLPEGEKEKTRKPGGNESNKTPSNTMPNQPAIRMAVVQRSTVVVQVVGYRQTNERTSAHEWTTRGKETTGSRKRKEEKKKKKKTPVYILVSGLLKRATLLCQPMHEATLEVPSVKTRLFLWAGFGLLRWAFCCWPAAGLLLLLLLLRV